MEGEKTKWFLLGVEWTHLDNDVAVLDRGPFVSGASQVIKKFQIINNN